MTRLGREVTLSIVIAIALARLSLGPRVRSPPSLPRNVSLSSGTFLFNTWVYQLSHYNCFLFKSATNYPPLSLPILRESKRRGYPFGSLRFAMIRRGTPDATLPRRR